MSGSTSDAEESLRKEALRKAGEKYFEKVLAQAGKGQDPFVPTPLSEKARRKDLESARDADLETVGLVLEGVKLYAIGAIYFMASTASLVLIQEALLPLKTPAIMVFLHMLTTVLLALFSAFVGFLDIGPFNERTLKGALPSVFFSGVQTLLLFCSLLHAHLYVVLGLMAILPHVMAVEADFLYEGSRPRPSRLVAILLGAASVGVCFWGGLWPGWEAGGFLLLFSLLELWRRLWQLMGNDLRAGSPLKGVFTNDGRWTEALAGLAKEEAKISAGTMVLYQNMLPAFPVLILGFLCKEGDALVSHELSVPAVSMILASCMAHAVGATTRHALHDAFSRSSWAILGGASNFGTIFLQTLMVGVGSLVGLAGCAAAVLGSLLAQV